MQVSEVRRSIISVQLLTRFAAGHGVTLATCLRNTGIEEGALIVPQTEILASQELQLVRNLVREIGHKPGIGLDAGLQYHLSAYGTWGFALVTSPSLRSAMTVALNFLDLTYAFVRFQQGLTTQHAYQLQLDDRMIPEDVRQFLFERDFSAWANAMREIRPAHLPVIGAEFRFPRPAYAERFRELCGIMPDFDSMAQNLHMAPRSLRRRLEEEGTRYRTLVDEVRQMLAEEFLSLPGMKLEEIAMRLGYSEPASFIHAFKRWKNVSPRMAHAKIGS